MLLSRLILGQVILWHTTEYLEVSFNNSAEQSIPGALNLSELLDNNGKADVAVLCLCQYADEGGRGTETAFNG